MTRNGWLLACLTALVVPCATGAQTTTQDLARRHLGVAWPEKLNPSKADAFNHNELVIESDCGNVYRVLASPADWPSWLPIARNVRLAALGRPLIAGARFSWSVFGIPIESVIFVAEPGRRFGYTNTPPGPPPAYAQSWLLTPVQQSCLVTTEEVGIGEFAKKATASGSRQVHVAHDLWLAALRWQTTFGSKNR